VTIPFVSPPDIEDTANCLQKVEYEQREHVDVSRAPKQHPITVWERLPIPMYVPANPHKYDDVFVMSSSISNPYSLMTVAAPRFRV
jgi:hypothetical protein